MTTIVAPDVIPLEWFRNLRFLVA
uniref:Uncharacterized protein n=1 Tax=Arundo donax TaxID=35708 RepID=A0A0A9GWC5_ARUDO